MEDLDYFTIGNINFIIVEDFSAYHIGDYLQLKNTKIKLLKLENVNNFYQHQIAPDEFVIFSNQQSDSFIIAK